MLNRIVYRQADAPLSPPATPTREDKLAILENYVREVYGRFGAVNLGHWCLGEMEGLRGFVRRASKYEPLAQAGFTTARIDGLPAFAEFFDISTKQAHHICCGSAYVGQPERPRGWRVIRHIRQAKKVAA